jgi:hypothetical protein
MYMSTKQTRFKSNSRLGLAKTLDVKINELGDVLPFLRRQWQGIEGKREMVERKG